MRNNLKYLELLFTIKYVIILYFILFHVNLNTIKNIPEQRFFDYEFKPPRDSQSQTN